MTLQEKIAGKWPFTTGEVAEICNVSQQTIIRCYDQGRLEGYRVPGSRFRRIPFNSLVQFMRANGMPLEKLGVVEKEKRILILHDDASAHETIKQEFSKGGTVQVECAADNLQAGYLLCQFRPTTVIVRTILPGISRAFFAERVKALPNLEHTEVVFEADILLSPISGGATNHLVAQNAHPQQFARV